MAAGFWVGTGSRDESRRTAGASHFLEHLLFKGTDRRQASDIAEAIDAVGGDMNAFTTKEYTAFYVRVLPDDLELGLDILNDIMWAPAFRPDEIETEREVILEEILMHSDEPSDLVSELFFSALYPDHSLGWDVLGDEETITAMKRDDICGFFAEHYRPANMVVALAGAINHDDAMAAIEKRFAGPPGGTAPVRQAPEAAPRPLAVVNRPTEQAHVVIGTSALDRGDDDRYALSILDHALGGGLSSRLFQEVREKRGLAYSVYSFRAAFADAGSLAVYAGTAPEHVHEVLDLVVKELDDLAANGVTERELRVAKGHLRGTMALGLEDSGSRMSRIGRSQLVHDETPSVDEINARIDAVTLDDVRRVSAKVLSNQRVLSVVGPFGDDDFAAYTG
ncbi:MAG: insulinase family protein [Actinobacteria bacterium]|nr:insulinase family protein [Actinomycetota bacterium]MBV9254696.1 insulinase family protein [Actinomycetota bacterium]MBV9666211.1 insulinase family protein [Actinomycetota bacterium]MBV9935329.1 insulinase family protein [Actinomycetota bacterium]